MVDLSDSLRDLRMDARAAVYFKRLKKDAPVGTTRFDSLLPESIELNGFSHRLF